MRVTQSYLRRQTLLAPSEALIAGGGAEDLEERLQRFFHQGRRDLLIDLRHASRVDSRGIRALVRGYTTAQRLGGTFALVAPTPSVRTMLEMVHLDGVFPIYSSVEEARRRQIVWSRVVAIAGASVVCGGLIWMGVRGSAVVPAVQDIAAAANNSALHAEQLWGPPLKLVAAALLGLLITAFHIPTVQERPLGRSMQHAQILLCVSGALLMMIIGGSLARAFGVVGAASIIRFRTPVEDPKDTTILFLLMALGMACGLGAFAVAGFGGAFLCAFLAVLDRPGAPRPRAMSVEIVSAKPRFPTADVERVFARNDIVFDPRELTHGEKATVTYHALVDADLSLDDLSAQLVAEAHGDITSVSWELSKKGF
jgi:anti-anti-sigma factor